MTRPTLEDLSPAQTILTNPGNEQITHGNPDLKPFRASQAEVGLEWYVNRLTALTAAVFYKNIDSFVAQTTTPQLVDQVTFQVTEPTNGKGATVKGAEFGYRQVFSWLPAPFDGFGAQASYTYVESDADYANAVSGTSYGLEGLSKNSYSAVGFYEKYGLQARVAWTWRDKFLQLANGRNGLPLYFASYGQLDASLSYDITKNFSVTADALNLTSAKEFTYSVTPNQVFSYGETGRRYALGVRARL
jgi:iron complex outermembrane recepter protein